MTIAIEYLTHAEANHALGLRVAVDDFLWAWLRYGQSRPFLCRPLNDVSYPRFLEIAAQAGVDKKDCIGLDPRAPAHNLGAVSCIFRPDIALGKTAWQRRQITGRGPALCGLLHSLAGADVTAALWDLFLAPIGPGDAVICPSRAIRDAFGRLRDHMTAYLDERFGSTHTVPLSTPIIPLGINTDKFASRRTQQARSSVRAMLDIADDEIVFLYVGRLSAVTKAHPLPLFQSIARAADLTDKKLRLVLYGYYMPQDQEQLFTDWARDFSGRARIDIILNHDTRFPDGVWAAADVFVSLVDNIQESFGLVPIEAMAAGLPVIASDWDGYRDGVLNDETGFLIPTCQPPADAGRDLATLALNQGHFGHYVMGAAQSTAVAIDAAAAAMARLADQPDLRARMGAAGAARARSVYDWRVVIPQIEDLWQRQSAERCMADAGLFAATSTMIHPHHVNPWDVFGSFSTTSLAADDDLVCVMDATAAADLLARPGLVPVPLLAADGGALLSLAQMIRERGCLRAGSVLSALPMDDRARGWRCLGLLLKYGILRKAAAP